METQNNDTRSLENSNRNDERIIHADVDTIINKEEHALQNRTKI